MGYWIHKHYAMLILLIPSRSKNRNGASRGLCMHLKTRNRNQKKNDEGERTRWPSECVTDVVKEVWGPRGNHRRHILNSAAKRT